MFLIALLLSRLDVIYLQDPRVYPVALFEIRMSAGDPEEIYENSRREVYAYFALAININNSNTGMPNTLSLHVNVSFRSFFKMYIVKEKQLYGPLFPCEITQIVLAKYKEVFIRVVFYS